MMDSRTVLVFALVAALLGTAVGPAAVTAAPSGFVGLPAENVGPPDHANAPDHAGPPTEIGPPNGLPTQASAWQVLASKHAGTLTVEVGTVDGKLALALSDAENHEGRQVALDAETLANAVGHRPSVVYGVHESGERWSRPVTYRDGSATFDVPHFSTNTVTFSSTTAITAQDAVDGSSWSYDLSSVDGVSAPAVTLTGVTATEWDNASAGGLGNGDSMNLWVAGNAEPTDTSVTFAGRETLFGESETGTGASDGTTSSFTVYGDTAPKNAQVRFDGLSSENSRTVAMSAVSSGYSETVSVGGNLDATGESVTFTGDTTTTANDQTDSGLSPTGSSSITVNGNLAPSGPTTNNNPALTVTTSGTYTVENAVVSSVTGSAWTYGVDQYGNKFYSEFRVDNAPAKLTGFTINQELTKAESTDNVRVDVYVVEEAPDGTVGEGTLVKSSWDPPATQGDTTITFDTPVSTNGGTVTVEFVTTSGDDSFYGARRGDSTDSNTQMQRWKDGSTVDSYSQYFDVHATGEGVTDLTVTSDDGTSQNFGTFAGSKTLEYDLSNTATSLDFQGSGDVTLDYTLDKNDRTATENPALDVDGDGAADVTHSGILTEGQTASYSTELSPGSRSVKATTANGRLSVDLAFTERTATENPSVDVDGDGVADASYSGVLMQGETATVSLSNLGTGSATAVFALDGGTVDWSLTYDRVEHTQDPSVDVDGDGVADASHSGTLAPGETVTADLANLALSSTSANVSTASGTTTDVTVHMRERTITENVVVEVNGRLLQYDGVLQEGETATLSGNSTWLTEGTNRVNLSVADVSADAPPASVGFNYSHSSQDSRTVDYAATKWTQSTTVNKSFPSSRADASVSVPLDDDVVAIGNLAVCRNSTCSPASTDDYAVEDSTLVVDLGSVDAGTNISVEVVAHKVSVQNGAIDVTRVTPPSDDLATTFEVTNHSSGFNIGVNNTADVGLLHYVAETSWSGSPFARVSTSGQAVYLPDAGVGSTATMRTAPLSVDVDHGHTDVRVLDAAVPKFRVVDGTADTVTLTYLAANPNEPYRLWSVDDESEVMAVDGPNASFSTHGGAETYRIEEKPSEGSAPPGTGAAPVSTAGGPSVFTLLALFGGMAGTLIGTVVVGRRIGLTSARSNTLLAAVGAVVGVVGVELVTPGSVVGLLLSGALGDGVGAVLLGVGVLGLLYLADARLGLPKWLLFIAGGLDVLYVVNAVTSGALADGLRETGALIWLLVAGGAVVVLYRAMKGPTINIGGQR